MTPAIAPRAVPYPAALYLAVVQFFFVTTWTLYVIFLPTLLETVGISRAAAIWFLLLDQLIFTITDTVAGIAADRVERLVGRLGPTIVKVTAVSCIAFLALPQVVPIGAEGGLLAQALMVGLTLVWTATSSCLRAPPWVMLAKYAAAPSVPWLAALSLLGLGIGSAVAPYLGTTLRNADPRLPFALSSITLFATTWGLIWVERRLAATAGFPIPQPPAPNPQPPAPTTQPPTSNLQPPAPSPQPPAPNPQPLRVGAIAAAAGFLVGAAVLALGYQVHISFNSAAFYLKFATAEQLDMLLPLFWVGYSLLSLPAASLASRWGSVTVMTGFALIGALGTAMTVAAQNLEVMVVGQLLAGGAWGSILMAGISAAVGFGRIGREGGTLGLWFSVQAMAAVVRIAAIAVQVDKAPGFLEAATWAPALFWLAGAGVLALLALRARAAAWGLP